MPERRLNQAIICQKSRIEQNLTILVNYVDIWDPSAVPRRIFIPLNWHGRPKNGPEFLQTSPIFF